MAYNVPAETNIFNILKQATQCLISHDITEANYSSRNFKSRTI